MAERYEYKTRRSRFAKPDTDDELDGYIEEMAAEGWRIHTITPLDHSLPTYLLILFERERR